MALVVGFGSIISLVKACKVFFSDSLAAIVAFSLLHHLRLSTFNLLPFGVIAKSARPVFPSFCTPEGALHNQLTQGGAHFPFRGAVREPPFFKADASLCAPTGTGGEEQRLC